MKTTRLIVIMALSLLFCNCKKVLDKKPQDFVTAETYFNNESDARAALKAAWDMLTRQYMFGGYWQLRMLAGDDIYCSITPAIPANFKIDASEPQYIPAMWNNLYTTIQYCNVLLDNLPHVTMDATQKGAIKGEGLFLRAYCYFLLADQWGAVPLRLTATNGPNDVNIPRTPIKDIYDQVLKDMTEAEGLVPTTTDPMYGSAGYAAKTTIEGMLARVCLTMTGEPLKDASKYQDAKNWAQKVVDSHEHALNPDYSQIFINLAAGIYDKKEVLWEIDFNDIPGGSEFGYLGYLNGISGANPSFGSSVGQEKVTRKLYKLYGATSNDTRRDWNCATWTWINTTTTGAASDKKFFTTNQIYDRFDAKYRLDYTPAPRTTGHSPINFPMLRYSDVLLMLAEAENYLNGPTDLAYSLVNQVRARAYGKLKPGATNLTEADLPRIYDKTTFLQQIQDERCRELSSEGIRKHDLIRWGIYVATIRALATDVNDKSQPAVTSAWKNAVNLIGTLVSNRDLLWPIPASELTYNNKMTQNPGW